MNENRLGNTASDLVPTKLYVTNFPQTCTRRHLTDFFNKFGQVIECAIMWDSYAFIHYRTRQEAVHALEQASRQYFMGQRLVIQLSKSKNRQDPNWYQREAARLQNEVQSSSVSESSEPVDSSDSSSSSYMVNIIETKLYVTNLPDDCDKTELKLLFDKYGNVLECVVMWNHYAFIHFSNAQEANKALKHLNGHLFGGKNLIVQLSTSSNRPLPKCIALNKTNCAFDNSLLQAQAPSKVNTDSQPATILCYRATELESSMLNEAKSAHRVEPVQTQPVDDTQSPTANLMDFIRNKFEMASLKANLFDFLLKSPFVDHDSNANESDAPMPSHAPYPDKLLHKNDHIRNPFDFRFSQIIDVSAPSASFQSDVGTVQPTKHMQNTSEKKIRRSRCRIVNYLLYPDLNESLSIK
jgi:RNA recognition motif-containing protein